MNQGYGSIFIRVFNPQGTVVFDRVTRLTYKHSDKAEDYSTIILESEDSSIVDHPDLQEDKALIVVWGYTGGRSRTHKVYIWDIKPSFQNTLVRVELTCYCKLAYLKLNSSKSVYNGQGMDEIAQIMADEMGLDYREEGLSQFSSEANQSEPLGEADITGVRQEDILNFNTHQIQHARDNTALVRYNFKKYSAVVQANESGIKTLDKLADREPTHNLVVDGHDDELIIRRRDFTQSPYKSYKYRGEPGTLLEFIPESRNSSTKKGAVSNSIQGWDETNKEFMEGLIDSTHSSAAVLGDMVEMTTEEILRKNLQNTVDAPIGQKTTVGVLVTQEYDGVDENGNPVYRKAIVDKLDSTKSTWAHVIKRGTTPAILDLQRNTVHQAMDATGRIELEGFLKVSPSEIIAAEAQTKSDIAGEAVNRQSKKQAELLGATAQMIGDPDLESAKVITILNVGEKYSGNYYIACVTHEVQPESGYICYVDLLKNGWNKTGNESKNKIDVRALGLSKNVKPLFPQDGTQQLFTINPVED